MYTVSQAEGLTGIPSTTLRAWERRYGIIAPRRTEGGYRLYDAAQIATLREMAGRVEGGMRPAQAAASLIDPQPPTATRPGSPVDRPSLSGCRPGPTTNWPSWRSPPACAGSGRTRSTWAQTSPRRIGR